MLAAGNDGNWLTEDIATSNYSFIGNRFMFTGRDFDSTTGIYYYRFRDYSPTLGRFLQPDPSGYADGMNLYAYCNNSPINFLDPWGLDKISLPNGEDIPCPPGYDPLKNAKEARDMSLRDWYKHVKPGGEWDYKKIDPKYEKLGNFNYGLTGRAWGFSETRLLREAGRVARRPDGTYPGPGYPGNRFNPWGGKAPFGDGPGDQEMIQQGFVWFDENMGKPRNDGWNPPADGGTFR